MQPDIEILPVTLSAADKALYDVSMKQRSIDEMRAVDIDISKILIMTRYQLCKQLFHDLPAEFAKKMVESTQAAEDNLSAKVYGEIEFSSFFSILQACEPKNGDVFVDLGHGSGKALIAALILCGQLFSRIHGIDIVPQIVEESLRRINKVQSMIDNNDPYKQFLENCLNGRNIHDVVTVETGDLLLEELSLDWTSADIVFANSTCFGFELMRQLSEKANRMKSGAKLITLTLPVHSTEFELLFKRNYPMSWGIATVFFQRKK